MRGFIVPLFAGVFAVATVFAAGPVQTGTGTIKGHVKITGKLPGNSVIRMGVDPKCGQLNQGKQVVDEVFKATADGSLGNVFVRLEGTFPKTPVPTTPVTIDQRNCLYSPRVVGMRVGQTLQIKNSDSLLHNVHSVSEKDNNFNLAQKSAGVVDNYTPKKEEVMMRMGCEVHRWMHAYVGVVSNPYFATSDASGNFTIEKVPPGTYTIDAWHEKLGPVKKTVTVTAGGTATVDFSYAGG
jgi:plastocyanin